MAKFTYADAVVNLGGTAVVGVKAASIELSKDAPEATSMGDDWRVFLADGLLQWSGSFQINQDHASADADTRCWNAYVAQTHQTFVLNPDGGTTSATNPKWSGNVIVTGYTPVQGDVGSTAMADVTFQGSGTLARATS